MDNIKSPAVTGNRLFRGFDRFYPGGRRPLSAPFEYIFNAVPFAFENRFNRSIRPVSDPAADLAGIRFLLCFHSEEYALDTTDNNGVDTDKFVHLVFPLKKIRYL